VIGVARKGACPPDIEMRDAPPCVRTDSKPSDATEAARRRIKWNGLRDWRAVQRVVQNESRAIVVALNSRSDGGYRLVLHFPAPEEARVAMIKTMNGDLMNGNPP
jgi:hypothetical protein